MENRIVKNPEVRSLFLKLFIALGIIMVITNLYTKAAIKNLSREVVAKNTAVIGNIVLKHPELESEIVPMFTREASAEEMKTGLSAAGRYGYIEKLPFAVVPTIKDFYKSFLIGGLLINVALFLIMIILVYLSLKRTYRKVSAIAEGAEKIVDGDFTMRLNEGDEGAFSKLSHQFNDMSKTLELSLQRLKDEKLFLKNIISDISHQLKTPLSSLKMFNELLLNVDMERSKEREFLAKSEEQLVRMEWLIINLLKMARLEVGAIELNKERIPVVQTIDEVVESLSPSAGNKNQVIEVKAEAREVYLSYDKGWLFEALSNIVKNSIEHTGQGGKIEVELVESPIMVRIVVKDNGEGIHEEDLPHIFDRFYKGKNNLHGRGTGIGLALAKSIIDNHDGIISVKSKIGVGTEFIITFIKGVI